MLIPLKSLQLAQIRLKILWAKILPRGVALIDNYAYSGFEYTRNLFSELAKELGVSILTMARRQGIIVKRLLFCCILNGMISNVRHITLRGKWIYGK